MEIQQKDDLESTEIQQFLKNYYNIRVRMSIYDMCLEVICILCVVAPWMMQIYFGGMIPNNFPIAYNQSQDQVTKYIHWDCILIEPILSSIIYLFLTIASIFPEHMSYVFEVHVKNAQVHYELLLKVILFGKAIWLFYYLIIYINKLVLALGRPTIFLQYFLVFFFMVIQLMSTCYYIHKSNIIYKNKEKEIV